MSPKNKTRAQSPRSPGLVTPIAKSSMAARIAVNMDNDLVQVDN